jgi:hypothetical protein
MSTRPELNVLRMQVGQFGDPEAGLDREHQEREISAARPRVVISNGEDRFDLLLHQKSNQSPVVPFPGHGQNPLNQSDLGWLLEGHEAEEGMDGRQANISASRTISALLLQMVQEGQDQLGIQVLDSQG